MIIIQAKEPRKVERKILLPFTDNQNYIALHDEASINPRYHVLALLLGLVFWLSLAFTVVLTF